MTPILMLLTGLPTIGILLCLTVSTGLAFQSSPASTIAVRTRNLA